MTEIINRVFYSRVWLFWVIAGIVFISAEFICGVFSRQLSVAYHIRDILFFLSLLAYIAERCRFRRAGSRIAFMPCLFLACWTIWAAAAIC